MLYKIKAKAIESKLCDFYAKLTDGTIEEQIPDGEEIINSMKGAKINSDGFVEWFETCYCASPLKHERDTQYNKYFSYFNATRVRDTTPINGESFWFYLKKLNSQ